MLRIALVAGTTLASVTAALVMAVAPHRAGAAGCGTDTPLQDGVQVLSPADFAQAQQILSQNCIVKRAVVLAFPPGLHPQGLVDWRYHRPGQRLLFTTAGYETATGCDARADQAGMAVFTGSWQYPGALSMVIGGDRLRDLDFTFYCMKFTKYVQSFVSIKAPVADSNTTLLLRGVTFDAMVFYLMGNTTLSDPSTEEYGRGAVITGNMGNLEVRNSIFASLVNQGEYGGSVPGPGHVHALYLRRGTVDANVHDNQVQSVSGDPFRVTNASNRNQFHHNTILNSGERAMASDWYNGVDEQGQKYMSPSWSNQIRENRYDHLYSKATLPLGSYCYDLRTGCPSDRFQATGNIHNS